jgi:outer membrane murein-binding lipoprotein Lpp
VIVERKVDRIQAENQELRARMDRLAAMMESRD